MGSQILKSMGRIAIVYPERYLDSVPTLMALVRRLTERGAVLDVFYCASIYVPANDVTWSSCRLVDIGKIHGSAIMSRFVELKMWIKNIKKSSLQPYSAVIGVDQLGLILANACFTTKDCKVFYLSLELLFWSELNRFSLFALKFAECLSLRRTHGIIIQDFNRARALRNSCGGFFKGDFFELPNCWPGGVIASTKSDRDIRDTSRPISLLTMGTCSVWTMTLELIQASRLWSNEFKLIVQSRQPLGKDFYSQELKTEAKRSNCTVIENPSTFQDLMSLVSSSDVGLVFYLPQKSPSLGKNLELTGKSSGKFSTFLQCSIPVIVNKFGGIAHLVEEYQCGLVVDNPNQIEAAAKTIMLNYRDFQNNAAKCFRDEFECSTKLATIASAVLRD